MAQKHWYTSAVFRGNQLGRTIGYPTINLDPTRLPSTTKPGVHASLVRFEGKTYQGALFFGPRLVLDEQTTVLEIYLFDFHEEIYEQEVSFTLLSYIRGVENFSSFEALQQQLALDTEHIQQFFASHPNLGL